MSPVTGAGRQAVKVTSERVHDGPVLRVGPWVRDRLFLFDLGYFRYRLFARITQNGGYFLTRLKWIANPTIVDVNRTHRGRAIPLVGERLRDVIGRMSRETLDVMVEMRFKRRRYGPRARQDRHCAFKKVCSRRGASCTSSRTRGASGRCFKKRRGSSWCMARSLRRAGLNTEA